MSRCTSSRDGCSWRALLCVLCCVANELGCGVVHLINAAPRKSATRYSAVLGCSKDSIQDNGVSRELRNSAVVLLHDQVD